jgi:hypothetical protein
MMLQDVDRVYSGLPGGVGPAPPNAGSPAGVRMAVE